MNCPQVNAQGPASTSPNDLATMAGRNPTKTSKNTDPATKPSKSTVSRPPLSRPSGQDRIPVALLWFVLTITPVAASDLMVSGEVALFDKDVWRGVKAHSGSIMVPHFSLTGKHFWFGYQGVVNLEPAEGENVDFLRHDFTLALDFQRGRFQFSTGLSHLRFPGYDMPSTWELFAGLFFEHRLEPALFVYQDVDALEGTYAQVGVFPSIDLLPDLLRHGVDLSVTVGYGTTDFKRGYYSMESHAGGSKPSGQGPHGDGTGSNHSGSGNRDPDSSGISDFGIGLEVPFDLGRGQLKFSVDHIRQADVQSQGRHKSADDHETVLGVAYSMSF